MQTMKRRFVVFLGRLLACAAILPLCPATLAAEANDLSLQQPERVERMKAALAAWQEWVVRSLTGADYPQHSGK